MKILTTGRKGNHASASRANGTLDAVRRPIVDEEKFAAFKVVVEIQNCRIVAPRVRGILPMAETVLAYHAIVSVDFVTEIAPICRGI